MSTAGVSHGPAGDRAQRQLVALARDAGMRVRGPNCLGLPSPKYNQANPQPGLKFADGTNGSGNQSPRAFPGADSGLAGTAGEQQVIAQLFAHDDADARPSAITTLLVGPVVRGTTVSQS